MEWVAQWGHLQIRLYADDEQEAAQEAARIFIDGAYGYEEEYDDTICLEVWTAHRPDIGYCYSVRVSQWWGTEAEDDPREILEVEYPDTRLIKRRDVPLVDGARVDVTIEEVAT